MRSEERKGEERKGEWRRGHERNIEVMRRREERCTVKYRKGHLQDN